MTDLVHGKEATAAVELAAQALFGRAELGDLDEKTLAARSRKPRSFEVTSDQSRNSLTCWWAPGWPIARGRRAALLKKAVCTSIMFA